MTPIHALAVETDTRLADLVTRQNRAKQQLHWTLDRLQRILGNRHSAINDTPERQQHIDSFDAYARDRWDRTAAEADAFRSTIAALKVEIDECSAVWRANGCWSRFFLVTNTNGHIHSSTACSTCRFDTDFRWLPTLSGLTEVEAVEAHGEILCSVCFPSAPVEWTNGESKASKEAKAERAAAKAEREAKRLAKALLPDGSTLTVRNSENTAWTETLATVAAAKTWLTDRHHYCPHPHVESVRLVAEALAAKNGTTAEAEIAAAKQRAAKRR